MPMPSFVKLRVLLHTLLHSNFTHFADMSPHDAFFLAAAERDSIHIPPRTLFQIRSFFS